MNYYQVYMESDGRNRRGANGEAPAKRRESDAVYVSPGSPFIVYDYSDAQGNMNRQLFELSKYGDGTFKIYFFKDGSEAIPEEKLFARSDKSKSEVPKKKVSKKKIVKKVVSKESE